MRNKNILLGIVFFVLVFAGNSALAQPMYKFQFVSDGSSTDGSYCRDYAGVVMAELVLQNPPPFTDIDDFVSLTFTAEGILCLGLDYNFPSTGPFLEASNPPRDIDLDALGLGSSKKSMTQWEIYNVYDGFNMVISLHMSDHRNSDMISSMVDWGGAGIQGTWEQVPYSTDSPYEVWSCGDFKLHGYQASPFIQYTPYGMKMGKLRKLDWGTTVFAVNFTSDGNQFGYKIERTSGTPITWFHMSADGRLVNSSVLFGEGECSYSLNNVTL